MLSLLLANIRQLLLSRCPTENTFYNYTLIYFQPVIDVTSLNIMFIFHPLQSLWEYLWPLRYVVDFVCPRERSSPRCTQCSAADTVGQASLLLGSDIKSHSTKSLSHMLLTFVPHFVQGSKLLIPACLK